MKKREKKLKLNKDTLVNLSKVAGGLVREGGGGEVASGGPAICYFSDCNPCETTVYADPLPIAIKPADGFVRG